MGSLLHDEITAMKVRALIGDDFSNYCREQQEVIDCLPTFFSLQTTGVC